MLNKIKIGPKLIGGFIIVSLIALSIGTYGIVNLRMITNADTELYNNATAPFEHITNMTSYFQRIRVNLRDMIRANSEEKIQYYSNRCDKMFDSLKMSGNEYQKTILTDEGKKNYDNFLSTSEEFRSLVQLASNYTRNNKRDSAYIILDSKGKETSDRLQSIIFGITDQKVALGHQFSSSNIAQSNSVMITMIITLSIGVIIAMIIGFSLTTSITKPMTDGVHMMQEMSRGHLGTRLKMSRSDEIGLLANAMDAFADDLQINVVGTMQKISTGDLTSDIASKDNHDEIGPALKRTIDTLHALVSEVGMLSDAAVEGRLSTRGNADTFKGSYKEIITGINTTLDSVINPVTEAANVLDKIAARDLTVRVVGDYKGDHAKIKNSLNLAAENLDKALQQVSEATEQVSSASQQISSGSQSLAQGANEQASSLEEVSSSLEEMSSMTKQNADNAFQAKNLSGESDNNAKAGSEAMSRMSSAINRIKESSDQTAKIVKTIDEIAMQTNLLALNAAVEAARAGEAGRGFAVVAEEVRNLAQRSAQAAKNTADMISESVKNAVDGVNIAVEVSKAFDTIAFSANKVNDLIAEIAAASQEQSQGIDQVNTAVSQLDKVTQQNAANSEESASAAEELSSQSSELKTMIDQFKLSFATSNVSYTHINPNVKSSETIHSKKDVAFTRAKKSTSKAPKRDEIFEMDSNVLKEF